MYLFSKRIKCLDCKKNFRGITERGKKRYICSGYHNYRNCTRWKIDEELLIELAYSHYEIELIKSGSAGTVKQKSIEKPQIDLETLLDRVDDVEVSANDKVLRISFKDGTRTMLSPNHQIYYSE